MAREIVLFSSEERQKLPAVSAFLRELADRLDSGQVVLRKGSEELTLDIPTNVVLEIKAEEEPKDQRTKRSLEIEIEWVEGEDEGVFTLG